MQGKIQKKNQARENLFQNNLMMKKKKNMVFLS